jgi:hypothetical protein
MMNAYAQHDGAALAEVIRNLDLGPGPCDINARGPPSTSSLSSPTSALHALGSPGNAAHASSNDASTLGLASMSELQALLATIQNAQQGSSNDLLSLLGGSPAQSMDLLALLATSNGSSPSQNLSDSLASLLRQQAAASSPTRRTGPQHNPLYKTELCRSWEEFGSCRYGAKCQFAHGREELRPVQRHPKYKTEICRTFATTGTCPYGTRCRFIHQSDTLAQLSAVRSATSAISGSTSQSPHNAGSMPSSMTPPAVDLLSALSAAVAASTPQQQLASLGMTSPFLAPGSASPSPGTHTLADGLSGNPLMHSQEGSSGNLANMSGLSSFLDGDNHRKHPPLGAGGQLPSDGMLCTTAGFTTPVPSSPAAFNGAFASMTPPVSGPLTPSSASIAAHEAMTKSPPMPARPGLFVSTNALLSAPATPTGAVGEDGGHVRRSVSENALAAGGSVTTPTSARRLPVFSNLEQI